MLFSRLKTCLKIMLKITVVGARRGQQLTPQLQYLHPELTALFKRVLNLENNISKQFFRVTLMNHTCKKRKKYTIFGKMPVSCIFNFFVSHTHIVRYIAVQVRVMHRISSIDGTSFRCIRYTLFTVQHEKCYITRLLLLIMK